MNKDTRKVQAFLFRSYNRSTQHRPCLTRNLKKGNSCFLILENLIRRGMEKFKMLTANKQKRHQWQIVEPQPEPKHKIQLCMYLFFCKTRLFGPLFPHDLVPYRNKGSTRCILKQFFSMEPSNKANTVCVQLVRPCNSSEHVQDSNFFITKCDTVYYKLRQYSISRLSYTNNFKLVYLKASVSTPLYKSRSG